jgi:hypothetical protein
VRLIKDLWLGVNGIIGGKNLASRAKIKNFEEVIIIENGIKLVKSTEKIKVSSAQYENYEWEIFPFLFETKQLEIKLNWKNSEFK